MEEKDLLMLFSIFHFFHIFFKTHGLLIGHFHLMHIFFFTGLQRISFVFLKTSKPSSYHIHIKNQIQYSKSYNFQLPFDLYHKIVSLSLSLTYRPSFHSFLSYPWYLDMVYVYTFSFLDLHSTIYFYQTNHSYWNSFIFAAYHTYYQFLAADQSISVEQILWVLSIILIINLNMNN